MQAYQNLKERFALLKQLEDARATLDVDAENGMPKGSNAARVAQKVAMDTASYKLIAEPAVAEWLDRAESDRDQLSPVDQRNLSLMRREWAHKASLPPDLAQAKSNIVAKGESIHYRNTQWDDVKDHYAASFSIARECGQVKKDILGLSTVYEPLLDEYCTGMRESVIDPEFARIEQALMTIIPAAQEWQRTRKSPLPHTGTFTAKRQYEWNKRIVEDAAFDLSRGRMLANDTFFTVGGRDDCYITTGFDLKNPDYGLIAHELGHGLYVQNLPAEWNYQPVGNVMGLHVHEMMAMVMECHASRTDGYLGVLADRTRVIFKRPDDPALTLENFKANIMRTNPSFIRVMADELTYPLHLMLRYRLERDAVHQVYDVKRDLPEIWNENFKSMFGITPANPKEGCMQDVHWPCGMIGYFPAYILGRMGAAQFAAAAQRARPEIARGDIRAARDWLVENVHSKGSLLSMDELFRNATGETLNSKMLIAHLRARFTNPAP